MFHPEKYERSWIRDFLCILTVFPELVSVKSKQIKSPIPRTRYIGGKMCVIAVKRGFCGAVKRNRVRAGEKVRICESQE